jgi:hypothetical protein
MFLSQAIAALAADRPSDAPVFTTTRGALL